MKIGVLTLRGYSLQYQIVISLNYIAGDIMQVRFELVRIKLFAKNCIYDLRLTVTFLVPAIRKYGALNGLSTETYETLHKYYVKNPYRSSNRQNVMRQLVNAVS